MPTLEIDAIRHIAGGPFSLNLSEGECVGLQGPSGSGKTLLLRAIADLDPHEGEVRLDGRPAGEFRPTEWRQAVGYLPAESAWWATTVRPHFPTPYLPEWDGMLSTLGFEADVLDWTIARLSTGERQRLSFARLIARSPQALLLDEPTASLDAENIERVEQLVTTYRRSRSAPVLLVSHDKAQILRMTQRSYRIAGGSLSPSGFDPVTTL